MYEINLVPDVKAEMIHAQKIRNVVFFASFVVSAMAIAIVVLLVMFKLGQDITLATQDKRLELMSKKLEEYDGLDEVLTVQSQLQNLEVIRDNKKMASRVFAILSSMLPKGADSVTVSSLTIDFESSLMSIDGQANAGAGTDGIDYRVLESFVKQVGLMKYDYGRYVDENGAEIPTMCIDESNEEGNAYQDESGNLYALWKRSMKGCNPSDETETTEEGESVAVETKTDEYIYRTPRFSDWYRNGRMTMDGQISGVAHFESQCMSYTGVESNGVVKWVSENDCMLAPEGMNVGSSSNGKQGDGDLVLTFTGTIYIDPEVFSFNNKHMIEIAPSGRTNVTDSFIQVEEMFSEKAVKCKEGEC